MGKTWAVSPLGEDCLVIHTSCPLFKPNSYIRTVKTDLGGGSLDLFICSSLCFSLLSLQLAYWGQVAMSSLVELSGLRL